MSAQQTTTVARRLFDVPLQPLAGSRFQPTGFPDIGPGLFARPADRADPRGRQWVDCLMVESAQSMANHLEAQGWDPAAQEPVEELAGLPYVEVVDPDGEFLTASRIESHRLASAYIKDGELEGQAAKAWFREHLGMQRNGEIPISDLAARVAEVDPLCLLHGVFFAEDESVWPGQPKLPRAVTAFVEAIDVEPAVYGGVKRDHVWQSLPTERRPTARTEAGYQNVIFHRTEYTAQQILASFVIDVRQIRSYGLGEAATDLLVALAEWEVRSLLDGGFRPRTACDLETLEDPVDRAGVPLASAQDLEARIRDGVTACADLFGDGRPRRVTWHPKQQSRSGS